MMSNIITRATHLRGLIEALAQEHLPDQDALNASELFESWYPDGEQYDAGERVRYAGILYKCLQAHTSQLAWAPDKAPSLWAQVLIPDPEVIPDWVQPESTNPYKTGDKVRHLSKVWVSVIDNNVWEPSVYGWDEVST